MERVILVLKIQGASIVGIAFKVRNKTVTLVIIIKNNSVI